MLILPDYSQFEGRHWETGSVANVLAYQHGSGEGALSEAMLLGLSGGVAFGYFVFDYEDTDPHVALLSRNTFDPLESLLDRLAVPRDLLRTASAEQAEQNLIEVLEGGRPAIVWADVFSLPYNALRPEEGMWAMEPVVVYGVEDDAVHIADRSQRPLTVSRQELTSARGRTKKNRFRMLALGEPNLRHLPKQVEEAILGCISLFTESPPKGARDNFGFAGYEKLASMLTNSRNKQSWERMLPPGRRMYAALAGFGHQPGAFGWARVHAANQVDDRALYADFLEEAGEMLGRSDLSAVATRFRQSSEAWLAFSNALLPDDVPILRQTRELLVEKRDRFLEEGQEAVDRIEEINGRLEELRAQASEDFPMDSSQVTAFRERLAEGVRGIRAMEEAAIEALRGAIA